MAEETPQKPMVYKQVASAGVAPELSAGTILPAGDATAFGQWLAGLMENSSQTTQDAGQKARAASLSGLSPAQWESLLAGQPLFALDADHVQRIASALVELGLVAHPDAVWQAAGVSTQSDYLVPPGQIVRAVSGN